MSKFSNDATFRRLAELGITPEQAAEGVRIASRKAPTREDILSTVRDAVGARMLFYSRKEDERIPVFAIEDAVIAGVVTIDEMVAEARKQIEMSVENRRKNPTETYP